jgi:two-component system, sensor histidine kinase and response regulator
MDKHHPIFFDFLLESAPVGLAFVDPELRFRYVNTALAEIDGPSVEGHIGRTLAEVLPKLAPQLIPYYQQVLSQRQAIVGLEVSGEVPSMAGEIKSWLVNYYPVEDLNGTMLGVGVVVQDITERKHAEQRVTNNAKMSHFNN